MNILVDTDALIAIAKDDDSNHQKAINILKTLKDESLYISPLTIPEATTVLSYRLSQKDACLFLEDVRKKNLQIIPLDKELENLADKVFSSQKK